MTTKVRVPQADGELTINGPRMDEPRTWRVDDHLVTARNDDELALLLNIEGARTATKADEPATETPAQRKAREDAEAKAAAAAPGGSNT
jgi:hypothetical protein